MFRVPPTLRREWYNMPGLCGVFYSLVHTTSSSQSKEAPNFFNALRPPCRLHLELRLQRGAKLGASDKCSACTLRFGVLLLPTLCDRRMDPPAVLRVRCASGHIRERGRKACAYQKSSPRFTSGLLRAPVHVGTQGWLLRAALTSRLSGNKRRV